MIKNRILDFWFEGYQHPGGKLTPSTIKKWFNSSADFDSQIKTEFEDLLITVFENESERKNLQSDIYVSNFFLIIGDSGVYNPVRPVPKEHIPRIC
jgi:uncharacterized protein (DUF924 family)